MSLKSPLFSVIPEDTQRVAKAAFPKGNRYLQLRDTFGALFTNADFRHLFSYRRPSRGLTLPASLISPSSSLPNGSPMNKPPMPSAAASTGSVRHEVALVEWDVVRKEVKRQQPQASVQCLFSPWRACW